MDDGNCGFEKLEDEGFVAIFFPCNLASSNFASTVYMVKISVVICGWRDSSWSFHPGFDSPWLLIDALSGKKIWISMGLLVISP